MLQSHISRPAYQVTTCAEFGRTQGPSQDESLAVVMVNEDANDLVEMLAVEEQEPIYAHRANHPHELFRDKFCLRSAKRRANALYPISLEEPVTTLRPLIPIANQEAEGFPANRQRSRQLPGLRRHPRPARIGRPPVNCTREVSSLMKKST